MVLLFDGLPFWQILLIASIAALVWYHMLCGAMYYYLYIKKNRAEEKTQAAYPPTKKVIAEAVEGSISVLTAALNISVMIYCGQHGWSQLVLKWGDASLLQHALSIIAIVVIVEVFEWTFHMIAHNNDTVWKIHKKHHAFANPTPYSVLSDHPLDMWVKSSPLLWLPFIVPIWDVALVGWFAFVNMIYGTYLHAGFEFSFFPSRNSKWFVSSWHHNVHHSSHIPMNYGFFTGFMDVWFGTKYTPEDEARDLAARQAKKLAIKTGGEADMVT